MAKLKRYIVDYTPAVGTGRGMHSETKVVWAYTKAEAKIKATGGSWREMHSCKKV